MINKFSLLFVVFSFLTLSVVRSDDSKKSAPQVPPKTNVSELVQEATNATHKVVVDPNDIFVKKGDEFVPVSPATATNALIVAKKKLNIILDDLEKKEGDDDLSEKYQLLADVLNDQELFNKTRKYLSTKAKDVPLIAGVLPTLLIEGQVKPLMRAKAYLGWNLGFSIGMLFSLDKWELDTIKVKFVVINFGGPYVNWDTRTKPLFPDPRKKGEAESMDANQGREARTKHQKEIKTRFGLGLLFSENIFSNDLSKKASFKFSDIKGLYHGAGFDLNAENLGFNVYAFASFTNAHWQHKIPRMHLKPNVLAFVLGGKAQKNADMGAILQPAVLLDGLLLNPTYE